MRASTLKALIIHTADDVGNPGPDYSFGWGLMNAKAGADQIKDHNDYPSINKIVEGLLNASNSTETYTFTWNGDTAIRATVCWTDPPAAALGDLDNPSPRLINDLDLRIIGPNGFTVYYPFVLDQANPASVATTGDNTRDNVEQVHISSPNTPGVYTAQASHKGTLTNDEQYYSMIISGQHHVPGPAGIIALDEDSYSCSGLVEIELRDGHLAGSGSEGIVVSTDGLDSETVTLYEDTFREGVFGGTISTAPGPASPGDEILQVAHGQIITAIYFDADDGNGVAAEVTDIAVVDCQGPTIFNVEVLEITSSAATITFETDEPASASLTYGLVCGGPNTTINAPTFAMTHSFGLSGLSPQTAYYFELRVCDVVGNETLDNNSGWCYQFTTATTPSGLWVPAHFPTIQQAIDVAFDGQTIWVADGTYTGPGNRDIDFKGKVITVRSENGPDNCVIDCQGSVAEPHRGFFFYSGEGEDSILSGFTITNGFGPNNDGSPSGGAVYCRDSSPTITNCILRNNEADTRWGEWGRGGAIRSYNCRPVISNCTIENNSARYGGGIYGSPTITNCTFNGNVATWGGAILCGGIEISNCIISNNRSYGYGGGIYCEGGSPVIANCLIINNTAYAPGMGGASGGGIEYSGGIGHSGTFINCTIVGNWAETTGGGIRSVHRVKRVTNCIVRDNWPNQFSGNSFDVTYSNIHGGFSGEGNIDTDPLFISANDYHLTFGSPCVDTGTNDPVGGLPASDIEGISRPMDGDADGNSTADMGAYEYWPCRGGMFMHVTRRRIEFVALYSRENPADQILSVRNACPQAMVWEITEDSPWLEVEPNSGESTGEYDDVVLSVDCNTMPPGDYDCLLTLTADGAENSPLAVEVGLNIVGPILSVSSNDFDFVIVKDSPGSAVQILSIGNEGGGVVDWQVNVPQGCDWLEVHPLSGSCTREVDEVTLRVDVNGLDYGSYSCELTVSDPNADNSPQVVQVDLYVVAILSVPTTDYPTIQSAIDAAAGRDIVLLADGIYTGAGNRDLDFGGKAITLRSTDPSDPCVVAATVIDCQYGGRGFHFHSGETASSVLAGLTITNGYADFGGGIFCTGSSPTIRNCKLTDNIADYGGGMGNQNCSPTVTECMFVGNGVFYYGGGMYNSGCTLAVSNCIFAGNSADWGGGMENFNCSGAIVNCTFTGNSADMGGGMDNFSSSGLAVINCILWGDSAGTGPEIYGSVSVSYSDVQGGYAGTGNIDADPCFVSGPAGDYYLSQVAAGQVFDSPCVDVGSDTAAKLGMHIYTTRTNEVADEGIVDMGYHYPVPMSNPADMDMDFDVDFFDYGLFAAGWDANNSMTIPMGAVVVDGNLGEWSEALEWVKLDKVYSRSPNDVDEAWFALQWDPNTKKIYAAVLVYDSEHVFLDEYVYWDASDRLEVYSQGDAEGGTGWVGTYDVAQQYYVAPNSTDGCWATWAFGEAIGGDAGFEYAVTVSGNEIIYEVGVTQFDNYGGFSGGDIIVTELDVGDVVGFDVVSCTRWSEGFGMLSENLMTGKSGNADQFAKYMLVGEHGGPPCLKLWASDLDGNCVINWADLAVLAESWLWGL
jgi:hypothetical protein